MLADLQNNVISAILLVMIVVVWALGVRTAALVGIAIPGAFLTGILIIYMMGLTVNVVVLFLRRTNLVKMAMAANAGAHAGRLRDRRGEESVAELCRREGLNQNVYYRWSKEVLEAGKQRLSGNTKREDAPDQRPLP